MKYFIPSSFHKHSEPWLTWTATAIPHTQMNGLVASYQFCVAWRSLPDCSHTRHMHQYSPNWQTSASIAMISRMVMGSDWNGRENTPSFTSLYSGKSYAVTANALKKKKSIFISLYCLRIGTSYTSRKLPPSEYPVHAFIYIYAIIYPPLENYKPNNRR